MAGEDASPTSGSTPSARRRPATSYIDVLGSGPVTHVMSLPRGVDGGAGSVMAVYFEADGLQFVGIDGGPQFTEATAP